MTGATSLPSLERLLDDLLADHLPKALAIQQMTTMLRQACSARCSESTALASGDSVQTILHYLTLVQRTTFRKKGRLRRWIDRFRDDSADRIRDSRLTLALADFDFTGVILAGLDFGRGTVFQRCTFDEANLLRVNCIDATFIDCSFERAILREATFNHGRFENCCFDGADLQGGRLAGSTFVDTSLRSARLVRTAVSGSTAHGCEFADADLSDAVFLNVNCYACSFEGVVTHRSKKQTTFQRSRFEGCSFRKANLSRADFRHAALKGCTLDEAKVDGTKGL